MYFFKMLSNVSNFSMYIFYCMCFYEKEQQQLSLGEKKKKGLYCNLTEKIKPKYNVYIYVLCGAVSWSYYPNFSIFALLLHWPLKEWTLSVEFKPMSLYCGRGNFLPNKVGFP